MTKTLHDLSDTYNEECLRSPELATVTERLPMPDRLQAAHGQGMLSRPLFLAQSELDPIIADLTAFFDLLTAIPDRLFGGDVTAYCQGVGIGPREQALMTRLGTRPVMHGRADLHHDGEAFRLLEFNVGTHLGGTDRAEIMRLVSEDDAYADFAKRQQLTYHHTGELIAAELRERARQVTDTDDPTVAFVEADGGLGDYRHLVDAFQEMMARLGLRVLVAEMSELDLRDDKLHLHGEPIDVVLRYFSVSQLVAEGADPATAEPFFRAHEAGKTCLYTGLEGLLYEQKTSLAVLSEAADQGRLGAEAADLVGRVLPWTRRLLAGTTTVGGEEVDLLEHCLRYREDLALKPADLDGGQGLVCGWQQTPAEWEHDLRLGLVSSYIVQQRVRPRAEPIVNPATGEVENWFATWGMFLTPQGYAGVHIRALPSPDGAIVKAQRGAVRKTGVFEYPG